MSKQKGSHYERELLHMFWNTEGWSGLRCPGSGSTPLPSPDLLVTNAKDYLAIECKALAGTSKYFSQEDIDQLTTFAKAFGAKPLIGIRFMRKGWFFLTPDQLRKTKNNFYAATVQIAEEKGMRFEALVRRKEWTTTSNM